MRLDAYYYGFDATGCEPVDVILSAVACAGKGFHQTEDWNDASPPLEPMHRGATPTEWIQNAAIDAAREMQKAAAAEREAIAAWLDRKAQRHFDEAARMRREKGEDVLEGFTAEGNRYRLLAADIRAEEHRK